MAINQKRGSLISVVLSFRNESDVLDELIQRLETIFKNQPCDYELIFIDDDSTDSSKSMLESHNSRNPRIKIITMARRFGVTECVFAGLEFASGDAIIYMDCDLQDPPEVIPHLLTEWRAGAEMVYTVRTQRQGEKKLRMYFTRLAYRLISSISSVELPVEAGDFRLLDRRIVRELIKLSESEPYLRGLTNWVGFRQAKVEYSRAPRAGGTTHFPGIFSKSAMDQFTRGITSFSFVPLFILFFIGLISISGGIFGGIVSLILHLNGIFWSPWLYFSLLSFVLWGGMMCALGVIGVYLARVYSDVRGRPRYIVADLVGFKD